MALKDEIHNDEEIHQSTKTCLVPIDAWEHQKNLIKSYPEVNPKHISRFFSKLSLIIFFQNRDSID